MLACVRRLRLRGGHARGSPILALAAVLLQVLVSVVCISLVLLIVVTQSDGCGATPSMSQLESDDGPCHVPHSTGAVVSSDRQVALAIHSGRKAKTATSLLSCEGPPCGLDRIYNGAIR